MDGRCFHACTGRAGREKGREGQKVCKGLEVEASAATKEETAQTNRGFSLLLLSLSPAHKVPKDQTPKTQNNQRTQTIHLGMLFI